MLGDGVVGPLMETVYPYEFLEYSFSYVCYPASLEGKICPLLVVSVSARYANAGGKKK